MVAPLTIRMNHRDNVAIVANDGGLPPGAVLPSGLALRDRVPQGHKVALADIAAARQVFPSFQTTRAFPPATSAVPHHRSV